MTKTALLLAFFVPAVVLATAGTVGAQEEPQPDLVVEKTGPATVVTGESPQYEFVVTNTGGTTVFPAETLILRDLVELKNVKLSGWTFGGSIGNRHEGMGSASHRTLSNEFSSGDIPWTWPAGASYEFFAQVRYFEIGHDGGRITNCATVDPDNVVVESNEENNTLCVTTEIVPAA